MLLSDRVSRLPSIRGQHPECAVGQWISQGGLLGLTRVLVVLFFVCGLLTYWLELP